MISESRRSHRGTGFRILTNGIIPLLLAGCASDDSSPLSPTFGETVRQTIVLQTSHPQAVGGGLDANKTAAVLKAYREDVGLRKKVEQPIILNVGGSGSSGR